MIDTIKIENFKSIKDIKFSCNKINLFIGEPNTGKSNLIECIAFITASLSKPNQLKQFIRFESMENLFFDELIEEEILIQLNDAKFKLWLDQDQFRSAQYYQDSEISQRGFLFNGSYIGGGSSSTPTDISVDIEAIKYYKYRRRMDFPLKKFDSLETPDGPNLYSLVSGIKKFRSIVTDILKAFDYRIVFKRQDQTFEIQKQVDDFIISHPYSVISDTVASIIFYLIAIESNSEAILVFEEPEAHIFPYYTKFLGEKIAKDKTNQYFIVTHNPYFLQAILEKADKDKVNVFGTYMENYETKVKLLSEEEKQELLDTDPFFNLENILSDED